MAPHQDSPLLNLPTELRLKVYRHVFPSRQELLATRTTPREAEPHTLLTTCHSVRWEANDEFAKYLQAEVVEMHKGCTKRSELDHIYREVNRGLKSSHPAHIPFHRVAESKNQQFHTAYRLVDRLRTRCTARRNLLAASPFTQAAVHKQMKVPYANPPPGGMHRDAEVDRRVRKI